MNPCSKFEVIQMRNMILSETLKFFIGQIFLPYRVGLVVSVSASHTVGRGFASWLVHTKNHHKNGTNCIPEWHAMR